MVKKWYGLVLGPVLWICEQISGAIRHHEKSHWIVKRSVEFLTTSTGHWLQFIVYSIFFIKAPLWILENIFLLKPPLYPDFVYDLGDFLKYICMELWNNLISSLPFSLNSGGSGNLEPPKNLIFSSDESKPTSIIQDNPSESSIKIDKIEENEGDEEESFGVKYRGYIEFIYGVIIIFCIFKSK